jgi:hypothetical protein
MYGDQRICSKRLIMEKLDQNNQRDSSLMNIAELREDPNKPGLLFAGRARRLCFFNDGDSKPN